MKLNIDTDDLDREARQLLADLGATHETEPSIRQFAQILRNRINGSQPFTGALNHLPLSWEQALESARRVLYPEVASTR